MKKLTEQHGWTNILQDSVANISPEMIHGRIIAVHRTNYSVITDKGSLTCELSGQLQYSLPPFMQPHTGDWVILMPYEQLGIITAVLPRKTILARKYPGKTTEKQILAANVDTAFLVQGLDNDYNPRRLERMAAALNEAGINPVIILNKMDIDPEASEHINIIKKLIPEIKTIGISALNGNGLDILEAEMEYGKTYVLLGTSGSGKSTLLNTLSRETLQKTGEISSSVGKGKHTTTSRELFLLPNGSLVIDTPGVREFGLALDQPDTIASSFSEINRLSFECRYPDCQHINEPGCAVISAVTKGILDEEVYQSYLKLKKEADHYASSAIDRKRKARDISLLVKKMKRDDLNRKK